MMDIDKILKEVKEVVKKENPPFILNVNKSHERPYIFLYMNGSNHLDYEFKDGGWIIHLDLNYGHRKELGKIKNYTKVDYNKDLWKKVDKPIRDFIDKLNKVFKETLKSESIKFITSKVKELLNNYVHEDEILQRKEKDNMEVRLVKTEDDYGYLYQVQTYVDGVDEESFEFRDFTLAKNKLDKLSK